MIVIRRHSNKYHIIFFCAIVFEYIKSSNQQENRKIHAGGKCMKNTLKFSGIEGICGMR